MFRAEESKLLEGFTIGRRKTTTLICNLQMSPFFFRAYLEELQTLKINLLMFGHIFCLKVNLEKSTLFDINID